MTEAGGNGHKSDVDDDMTTYVPAYYGTDLIGWWAIEPGEEEGTFIPILPELEDDPPSTN